MFLPELSGNHSMKESIQAARQGGMPIYAECGGFMYLTRTIMDFAGRGWAGVGIIPAEVKMSRQLQALGYVEATAGCDSIIAEPGDKLRGHEFHYSTLSGLDNCQAPFSLKGGKGEDFRPDGYVEENLLASYVHLHMRSNPGAASRFLAACRLYKSKQERRT